MGDTIDVLSGALAATGFGIPAAIGLQGAKAGGAFDKPKTNKFDKKLAETRVQAEQARRQEVAAAQSRQGSASTILTSGGPQSSVRRPALSDRATLLGGGI